MPNVSRTGAATASARSRRAPQRFEVLKKLQAAVDKVGRPYPDAKVEILDYHRYSTPNGEAVFTSLDDKDESKMGVRFSPMKKVLIDEKNKEFYFTDISGDGKGPFKLPRGVKLADLFDDGSVISRGKTKYEKSISKLMRSVKEGLAEAKKQGNVDFDYDSGRGGFISPSDEVMYHHYIDVDFPDRANSFHMPGGALMLGKDEFWVEQIPGVSGNCIGPFPYPSGFELKDIKAKDARAARAADRADDAVDNDSGSRRRRSGVIGSDSDNYRPAPRRTGSGGNAGRSPAYWRPS